MIVTTAAFFLVAASAVRSQDAYITSLFPVAFQGDDLRGSVLGSGPQGTTYLLTGAFDSLSISETITLLQGPSIVSEGAILETAGATISVSVQCGIGSNDLVTCTEAVIDPESTALITETGSVENIPITIGTGSVSGGQLTRTATGTSSDSTANGAGESLSNLPASVSVLSSASRTATVASSSASGTSAGSTSGATSLNSDAIFGALVAGLGVVAGGLLIGA